MEEMMGNNMEAPERIWLDTKSDSEVWAWDKSCAMTGDVEYIRADLAAPSAPAEVEGLVERHQDKMRNIIINRTSSALEQIINGHDPEIDNLGNRVWDRLDMMACEIEARHATPLFVLQAENERLIAEVETLQGAQIVNRNAIRMQREAREKSEAENERLRDLLNISIANLEDATARADKAEAERDAWKAVAEGLHEELKWAEQSIQYSYQGTALDCEIPHTFHEARAAYEKLKGEV